MPWVRLDDVVSLRFGVLWVVLSLWRDNTEVAKAEQSWPRRGLRAGPCLWWLHFPAGAWCMQAGTGIPDSSVGMDGCHTWPGMVWEPCVCTAGCSWLEVARWALRVLNNAPACIGAGRAAWVCPEALQLIVRMLWVLAAPALPPAWH